MLTRMRKITIFLYVSTIGGNDKSMTAVEKFGWQLHKEC